MILVTSVLVGCGNKSEQKDPIKPGIATEAPVLQPTVKEESHPANSLPPLRIVSADNSIKDLSHIIGKKVFVNLWATWCPPCRAEIPSIEILASKVDVNKVEFILLSLDDNFEKAKTFASNTNMRLPVYHPASNLPGLFNVEGIPATFIFDEKGSLIFRQDGSMNFDSEEMVKLLSQE